MVELLEDSTIAAPGLRIRKISLLKSVAKLHVAKEFGNRHGKKEDVGSEDEIPFEKWIMPPQPEKYIKGNTYEYL